MCNYDMYSYDLLLYLTVKVTIKHKFQRKNYFILSSKLDEKRIIKNDL